MASGAYMKLPAADASLDNLKDAQREGRNGISGSKMHPPGGSSAVAGEGSHRQVVSSLQRTGNSGQSGGRQDSFRSELLATEPAGLALRKIPIREGLVATNFDIAVELGHSNVQSAQRHLDLTPIRTSNDRNVHAHAPESAASSRRAEGATPLIRKQGVADIVTPPRR